jgi:hypothetical protein
MVIFIHRTLFNVENALFAIIKDSGLSLFSKRILNIKKKTNINKN